MVEPVTAAPVSVPAGVAVMYSAEMVTVPASKSFCAWFWRETE